MRQKTIGEEVPTTKEGLQFFINALEKELNEKEPVVRRMKEALKQARERLEKILTSPIRETIQ